MTVRKEALRSRAWKDFNLQLLRNLFLWLDGAKQRGIAAHQVFHFFFFFFLLCCEACRILFPLLGTEARSLALKMQSSNHWTAREFPFHFYFDKETQVRFLGQEDPLEEEEMATHSSIITWEIHGQRSLVGRSPWGGEELDTT